nr:hypothetical protein [Tanacetum cinerariifolium]
IEITATIDGKVKIVTEASVRRHLKLADSDGISSLPTTDIFEQLSLMRVKDQQSQLSPITYPQPSSPPHTNVADEATSTDVDVRHGGATTTITRLDVEKGNAYQEGEKLEKIVKSSQARRRARIVISDDEDDLEDSSKQGRKIAAIDQDLAISLVQHDAKIQERNKHDMEASLQLIVPI